MKKLICGKISHGKQPSLKVMVSLVPWKQTPWFCRGGAEHCKGAVFLLQGRAARRKPLCEWHSLPSDLELNLDPERFLWQVLESGSQIWVLARLSFLLITLTFRKRSPLSLGNQKRKIDWEGFVRIYKEDIFYWLINSFVAKSTLLKGWWQTIKRDT